MITSKEILETLKNLEANPSTFHHTHLSLLENITQGRHTVIDANNPFAFLTQTSAINSANAINASWTVLQNQYPKLAETAEQLYHHMSDNDYLERFAQPCRNVPLIKFISLNELEEILVEETINGKKIRQVIIPRDTNYRVKDLDFHQHENIVIRENDDGSFRASYDYTNSPRIKTDLGDLKTLISRYDGKKYLVVFFEVDQLTLTKKEYPVTKSGSFDVSIPLSDQYHYCRVLQRNNVGQWTEVETTHSDLVYDQQKLTAVLKLTDNNNLRVKIPEIYQSKNLLGDNLMVIVYTTKGPINYKLEKLPKGSFSIGYRSLLESTVERFTAPMDKLSDYFVIADNEALGGKNAMSFEALREKVIYSPGDSKAPVIESRLLSLLKREGFKPTKLHATILGQDYLASNYIEGEEKNNVPAIGVTFADIILDSMKKNYSDSYIVHNTSSSVLTPKAIFKRIKGGYELLTDTQLARLNALEGDELVRNLNGEEYFYNPFFIVVDETNSIVTVRSYYLDDPKVKYRSFKDANVNLGLNINTDEITLTRHDEGFTLKVEASVPKGLIDVNLQLKLSVRDGFHFFLTPDEVNLDSANKKAYFTFNLKSNFAINSINLLEVQDVLSDSGNRVTSLMGLETNMDLYYLTSTLTQFTSAFDSEINQRILPTVSGFNTAVTHESAIVHIGTDLTNYYVEGKSVIIDKTYKKHTTDKPKVYDKSILKVQDNGLLVKFDDDDNPIFEFEHEKGDPILQDGEPVFEYKEGDLVRDIHGRPIEETPERREKIISLPLYDANFKYATDYYVKNYVDTFPKMIANRTNPKVHRLAKQLIERSTLYYAPVNTATVTLGQTNQGTLVDFNTALRININLTATHKGLSDDGLKNQTESRIIKVVKDLLMDRELSLAALYKAILKDIPDEVLNVDIVNFLPEGGYVKLRDELNAFSLKSIVKFKNNGDVDIEDDIRFNWLKLKEK